jgi:hypothetical protein
MSEILGHERYIFPAVEGEYDREKALVFWFQVEPDEIISSLASEMIATFSHIRLDLNIMLAEPQKDQIVLIDSNNTLTQMAQSIWASYTIIQETLDIIYFYESNRGKRKRLAVEGKSLGKDKLRYPEILSADYVKKLSVWYEQEPIEFLSTIVPIVEPKILQSGVLIQTLHNTSGLDTINMFEGKFTLEHVAKELLRCYSVFNEEFFLLKSYLNSYSQK